jgi:endoglycosylceramidase
MRWSLVGAFAVAAGLAALAGCSSARSVASGPADAASEGATDDGAPDAPPAASCTIAPPMPGEWRLHADGAALRDALGRAVFLRGVNAGGRSKFAPYMPFDFAAGQFTTALGAYMDRAASWGIDAMRVPFTWAALEPTQGHMDPAWLAEYKQLVDVAWAHGIWVIADFHQDVYSECFCGDGFPSWTVASAPASHHDCPTWSLEYSNDTGVRAAFDAFWAAGSTVMSGYLAAWDAMIAQFKDEPGVVGFEPMNEPGPGTQVPATFESTTLSAFYTQMVARMRQAAPQSLVFVDTAYLDGASGTTTLQRPTGDGIVFAPHYYPLGDVPGNVLPGLQKWATVGAAWNVPVLLGEFGEQHGSTGVVDYITACFAALDTLGMSGTQWEYSVASEEWNSESYEVVAADGTEYPVVQALMRPFARAVAGTGIAQSWDPPSRTFTLSYAPTGGVSEVSLPARVYPQGWTVAVTGGCYDAASSPGRVLVQPDAGATQVKLKVSPP